MLLRPDRSNGVLSDVGFKRLELGDLFLLAAVALKPLWTGRNKGRRKKKTFESKSPPFLFDLPGVSRPRSPLR